MNNMKIELNIGDWCYVFGDDTFVQIYMIVRSHDKIKHVYATNGVDGIFCDKSLYWLCKKDKNPEQIFHALSYDEIEKRRITIN